MKDEYGIDLNIAKAPIHHNKHVKMVRGSTNVPNSTPDLEKS
jgi:hypothetical protein